MLGGWGDNQTPLSVGAGFDECLGLSALHAICSSVKHRRCVLYSPRKRLQFLNHFRLQEQYDAVGVLLMIRINAELRRLMSRRRVPCLDDYLDRVNLLLWPRFKVSGG